MTPETVEPDAIQDSTSDGAPNTSGDQESLDEYATRIAMRLALPAGLIVGLLVVLLNIGRNPIPMMEDLRSFGIIGFLSMLPITFVVSGIGFVLGVKAWNERVDANGQRQWGPPVIPIAIAYTLVVGLSIALMLMLAEQAFQFLELIVLQSAFITGAAATVITFWIVTAVMKIRTGKLLQLIVVFVAAGLYLTAVAVDDPLWWQVSFSYLGKLESNANFLFNMTLVFTGILLLTWMGYFMNDYRILVREGIADKKFVRWVRYGFAWLAIAIMLVGIFKSNYTPFSSLMHNLSAYSLALVFGLFMLGSRWIVPAFPKEFFAASWILVAMLAGVGLSAALGRMNTVGLEMAGFALGMAWLFLFVGNTEDHAVQLEPDSFPD